MYFICTVGISKKIDKISKIKDCEKLQKWMKSINNHIYWTAATSTTGPERVAKWTSILNHVQDIYTHDDPLFPACLHESHQTRDKKKWLSAGYLLDRIKKLYIFELLLRALLSSHLMSSPLLSSLVSSPLN